jgi:hypothetical protein
MILGKRRPHRQVKWQLGLTGLHSPAANNQVLEGSFTHLFDGRCLDGFALRPAQSLKFSGPLACCGHISDNAYFGRR